MSNDTALGAFVGALSQALLTLFGVDYYAITWAFVGSLVALTQTKMTTGRAVVYVCLSTLVGAALGSGAYAYLGSTAKPVLLVSSVIGGFGWQLLLTALVQAVVSRIRNLGGVHDEPPQSTH